MLTATVVWCMWPGTNNDGSAAMTREPLEVPSSYTPLPDPAASEDLAMYARRALSTLRGVTGRDEWRVVYERGLAEAQRRNDPAGLAAIVALAMSRLDAEGRSHEAVEYLDFALTMAHDSPDAVVLLQSMRATYEALQGNVGRAESALRTARGHMPRTRAASTRLEYEWSSAVVAAIAIRPGALPRIKRTVARLQRADMDAQATFVLHWLITMLFALGLHDSARPWIEALRVYAGESRHAWRGADALTFEYGRRVALASVREPAPVAEVAAAGNWLATWRLETLELRSALLQGDWAHADTCIAELERIAPRMSAGMADGLSAFVGLAAAYRGDDEPLRLIRPPRLSLVNVGPILAAAEAAAIAGSQAEAAEWLQWTVDLVPAEVQTAFEWPVAKDRVFGLLLLRAGREREAVSALRRAFTWARTGGYEIEAAIAQTQLAEVLALGSGKAKEQEWSRLRRAGWLKLREYDIDPTLHAYVATRPIARARAAEVQPTLTERQVVVLQLLAEGLTYREVGERLGTSWRTVSTQAHQIYERLGVRGKIRAVREAQRLQLL